MGLQKIILVVTRGLEPFSYRGALPSTLLHATVYNLLHVLVRTANKMGVGGKKKENNNLKSHVRLSCFRRY
jgi:hypothetical protein